MEMKKTFDAVKMVRSIRDSHFDQTKDLSISERLAYYRAKSRALREKLGLMSGQSSDEKLKPSDE